MDMNSCETPSHSRPALSLNAKAPPEANGSTLWFGLSGNTLGAGLLGAVLLSIGASRFPSGGVAGFLMGLTGFALCLVFALALGEGRGTRGQRLVRIPFAIVGLLLLWAGTIATAIVVAHFLFARAHYAPFTPPMEIVPALACAVIGPALLTFKCGSWLGMSGRAVAALWGFWLAPCPLTILATGLGHF